MTEKKRRTPTSDGAANEERIPDGRAGLKRTEDLMRRLLKVPKADVMTPKKGANKPRR